MNNKSVERTMQNLDFGFLTLKTIIMFRYDLEVLIDNNWLILNEFQKHQ